MAKLILVLFLAIFASANELVLKDGQIQAHTEVFGDSTIDPKTKEVYAEVKKDTELSSISGKFEIKALSLISDNLDRDKHMYKILKVEESPKITFTILHIMKLEDSYKIDGILEMNHIKKEIFSIASINEADKFININGVFSIKLTDFNLEPPTMFFLTVRDQIDIKYAFNLKEK